MEINDKFYQELIELIDRYGLNKQEFDDYKIICDNENKQLKDMMAKANLKAFNTDKYRVNYIVSERTSTDEDKMIAVIHKHNLPNSLGIIKTKEYIDEDALESAIYDNEIPKEVMDEIAECITKKEIISLKLTRQKGE